MNNINAIYSINNSYLPAFKQKAANNNVKIPEMNTNVSMNGIDALAAYNMGSISKQSDSPEYINLTFEEQLASLKAKGKKEGIDYNIEKYQTDSRWIELKDKSGNITDRIEYVDGKFSGCEISTYQNNRLVASIGRSKDRIETSAKIYYRNEYPQEKFTVHGINHETTPEKFTEYLKNNNIKYDIKYTGEEDNNRSVSLTEYDRDGKATRGYWWFYGQSNFDEQFPWVAVSELNDNEEEVRRITLGSDETEICDYGYRCKSKDYKNSEYDIKTLTDAGITFQTTPEEYVKYLDEKGIKYKVKEIPELTGEYKIVELDESGKQTASTMWINEPDSNKPERICRWEISDNGRKRFDFYPDITETMTLRYI